MLLIFIKIPFVIKIFVLSIFEWPFYTGFTVFKPQGLLLSILIFCCCYFFVGCFSKTTPTRTLADNICKQVVHRSGPT